MVGTGSLRSCSGLWLVGAVTGLCLLLPSGNAEAQSEADKQRAAEAMARGDDNLRRAAFPDALESYRQADAIMGVPTTRLAVARALERCGKLIEAREAADSIAGLPRTNHEPTAFLSARAQATELLAELDARIPSLTVMLSNRPSNARSTLRVDGVITRTDQNGATRKVNPGRHRISALIEGLPEVVEYVDLVERENRTVTVQFPLSPAHGARETPRGSIPTLSWVGFGVGGALLAAGTATGLMTMSRTSDLKDKCGGNVCLRSSYENEYNATRTLGWVSNIALGLGAVGVGVGIASLLVSGQDSSKVPSRHAEGPQVSVVISPHRWGLEGTF